MCPIHQFCMLCEAEEDTQREGRSSQAPLTGVYPHPEVWYKLNDVYEGAIPVCSSQLLVRTFGRVVYDELQDEANFDSAEEEEEPTGPELRTKKPKVKKRPGKDGKWYEVDVEEDWEEERMVWPEFTGPDGKLTDTKIPTHKKCGAERRGKNPMMTSLSANADGGGARWYPGSIVPRNCLLVSMPRLKLNVSETRSTILIPI